MSSTTKITKKGDKNLSFYLETMKILKKRLEKDNLLMTETDISNTGSCRCLVDTFLKMSHLRMDGESLDSTLGVALVLGRLYHHQLDFCPSITMSLLEPSRGAYPFVITNLYLQRNNISKIEGLELLGKTLKVLVLSYNKISNLKESTATLRAFVKLGLLDLSYNEISDIPVDPLPFPNNLVMLDLRNNHFKTKFYKELLLDNLPKLLQIDGEDFHNESDEDEEDIFNVEDISSLILNDKLISTKASDTLHMTTEEIIERSKARVNEMLSHLEKTTAKVEPGASNNF